ncbi:MAG: MFS transporter [Anaerolineales bacterium]|jgi:predicted MFS family arabinose efflux permease
MEKKSPQGMLAFTIIAIGQAISLLGSGMTQFAIVIWAWQETGQATVLALTGFFAFGPVVLVSPFAGALVDRWNRKLVMMLSDLAAGLATIILLILFTSDSLQIWHLYVLGAFVGVFQAFQWPAFSAAISVMLPKEQYARANGILELARAGSGILAPVLAGALIGFLGISWVFLIDIITFLFAIGALLIIHVPQPKATKEGLESRGSIWKEAGYGFKYIWKRPSLFWLQMVFFFINLTATFGFTVLAAMVLARTNNNATILGSVQSAGAAGGVAGGILLSAWGGPKRRIHGVLLSMISISIFNTLLMGIGRSLPVWAVASFIGATFLPILNGSNQAIWQAKVPPDLQGRVFSVRRLIAQITAPFAMLLAGPLADYVFEPAMNEGGTLAPIFGGILGTGPGSGMALMFIISGTLGILVGLGGYAVPIIRNVEDILPDHDAIPSPPPALANQLQKLIDDRQRIIEQPNSPARDLALRRISERMREIGRQPR